MRLAGEEMNHYDYHLKDYYELLLIATSYQHANLMLLSAVVVAAEE